MNKWNISMPDKEKAAEMVKKSNLTMLCAEVLVSRGYNNLEAASEFIKFEDFRSPYEIKDMKEASEIILDAVDNNKYICIYGDYDCDGVTSTVILYSYLAEMGANVRYYIPEREEGYGMNKNSIKQLHDEGVELIITVDNGITAIEEAKYIKELGMTLVITDHHQPLDELPCAAATVDPHREDDISFFKYFCGAGIAFKLIAAMEDGDYTIAKELFSEIAAIGTIGDVVSLTGENRNLVHTGMFYLKNTERPGITALKNCCGFDRREPDAVGIAFSYVPRINAAGRFSSPKLAVELLLSETEEEAKEKAEILTKCNEDRKKTEEEILQEIYILLEKNPEKLKKRVLVVSGENWHHGVIGIVASRLMENFGMPVFIISIKDGEARGSSRAFGDFSVFEALKYSKDVLTKFGGHQCAGGFSLLPENIEKFDELLQRYAAENNNDMPVFTINADALLMPDEITVENAEGLSLLQPYGEGNSEPVFAAVHAVVEDKISLSENKHTKLALKYGNSIFSGLIFRKSPDDVYLKKGDVCDILFTLNVNEFRGKKSVSLFIKDYRKSGIKQSSYFASVEAYKKYNRNEEMGKAYYKALTPSYEELVSIYKSVDKEEKNTDNIYMNLNNISYGKFLICMDIFEELGLVDYNPVKSTAKRKNVTKKADLSSSEILKKLKHKGE
ncbi:MAG: single-stranded-DNA-specific exonuclease RecJ [Oscillospiraceae bacterium]|nr:single-stranded-DNA-specific exonuclease RecJ [Oscillospiraceae bacterium]MDY3257798.1 single-stranded-DNA-specific exonuclease RecJ [Ruminococcus callidus]